MLFSVLVILAGLQVACKPSVLLSKTARQISIQLLDSAKRDIEPSLKWAAIQMESLVPVDLATIGDSVSSDSISSDSWSFPSDQSIAGGWIPDEIIIPSAGIRPEIIKAVVVLGKLVIKALKPGLSEAVVHLLKNHTANPLTKDQLFSKEELSNFVVELSGIWSDSLKKAVNEWSNGQLDVFLGFVRKILSCVGSEILKRLGIVVGFMSTDHKNGRMQSPKSTDLFDNIRDSSHKVALASLTFLHGTGWMSKQMTHALPKTAVDIQDDWKHGWDIRLWEMWDR